ncbi:hypothetical protein MCOR12_000085 [Pyricularia oryzae]|nr:hypothetical protein MCOR10_000405 [Pyricularia oryzae]KAI6547072.1 hypothetical protein MCOR05_000163 [Pyricularia oryzae]KAI6578167.1 hypothetical protein MCOR09_000084 [Pyricularia oryzae]KAI6607923.1 hypothetical protein MCOR12_000085 [Pyricularia oryzae]
MHPTEPDAAAKYRIRDRNSWTEVFDQLEAAKVQYYQTKGFKGGFSKIYRKSGDNVQPLIGVAKALPDIDMVTPVLGVVQAAKHAAQVRQAMSGAFDGIEPMFSQIELFLKTYPGDENIKLASIALIAVTFHVVDQEACLGYIQPRGISTKDYTKLGGSQSHSEALTTEANDSDKYMSSNTAKRVVQATHQSEKRILQSVHSERTLILTLFQELHDNLARKQTAENTAMFNMIQRHLSHLITPMPPPSSTPPPMHRPAPTSGAMVTSAQLLDVINIPNLSAIDMHTIQERRNDLIPRHKQAKTEHIMNTTEFRSWLMSAASSQLLVHGDFDPRPVSGTTHFCTTLIKHIAEHPRHLSLNFFCGQHLEPCNPHSGGRAMIQMFLCQLLNQCDFGPQYQVNQELELIRASDVKELYRMFESLFRRIDPSLCVFCIIDGVVFYERDEFLQDLGDVIPMIVKLSAEHDTHMPILKFLIASPTKTSVV